MVLMCYHGIPLPVDTGTTIPEADTLWCHIGDEQDVTSVVVDGKVIMRDKQILTIDAERVRRDANALAAQMRAALAESPD